MTAPGKAQVIIPWFPPKGASIWMATAVAPHPAGLKQWGKPTWPHSQVPGDVRLRDDGHIKKLVWQLALELVVAHHEGDELNPILQGVGRSKAKRVARVARLAADVRQGAYRRLV